MNDAVQEAVANIIGDFERNRMATEAAAAERDPEAFRKSRVFVNPTTYRWYRTTDRSVRYCYSCHRNVAGFFLTWREVRTGDGGFRELYGAWKSKRSAISVARRNAEHHGK